MLDGAIQRTVTSVGAEIAVSEAGDPARPTIIFIHGYPDTKELWDGIRGRLADRFHVVAYDVRGAGRSSVPRWPVAYDFERLADDLEAVSRAVAPGGDFHLVGHDWGGLQGWEFATTRRFDGALRSFTSIAGPSVDQVADANWKALRAGRIPELAGRVRRSWYIALLCAPGGPTLLWRGLLGGTRWAAWLRLLERLPVDSGYPQPTIASDGVHGAKLYRRNITRRVVRPRRDAVARVPVQLVIPSRDRFISDSYYAQSEEHAPSVRRRRVAGSHWAPRGQPALVARWVGEFVDDVEAGREAGSARPWVRAGGVEQLRGRLALVTGAGSGIGRATARALAAHGARVLLVDRDRAPVEQTAASIPEAATFTCDVSDEQAMEQLAARVIGEHGVPDVVVNNAGIGVAGTFTQTPFEQWRRVLDVNVMGVIHGSRLFGQALIDRGLGGQIVNTSSAAAFQPAKELAAYAASKAAVLMASECLRAELVPYGIGVTAVCPGVVATNITATTHYAGRTEVEQERLRTAVTNVYRRRNFTPERVAAEIVAAIGADTPVAAITPEAKAMRAMSRVAPGLLRRLAGLDALPT
jgi:NAD(P)-dependent dehydrogenase (short-subunit alcohol dehydrogenase family)/pimeloyl-ACP methyl ester carboxylesterase